jgi:site-specific DNA-methyltransferase (adenine-specific)
LAEWDAKILADQLIELDAVGWDVSEFGFEALQPAIEVVDDEPLSFDEVETRCKPNDLWILGDHKLLCGDSLEVTAMDKLLGSEKADIVWTDPPYGVDYVVKKKDALKIENDNKTFDELEDFLRAAFNNIYQATRPGACWYVAAPSGDLFLAFARPLKELAVWRHTLVWVKDTLVMGRADYHYRHESIFYGWTPGAAHHEPPDRKQDTVWEISRPKANKEHPTMKPIELIARALKNSAKRNQIVLDAFGGSGSTLIAAEQLKMRARIIELDPKYCDVILARWEKLTGQSAERLES